MLINKKYSSRIAAPFPLPVTNRVLQKGSSGGPYLVNFGNELEEQWIVAGVVSAATNRCRGVNNTVFTIVDKFAPWINSCADHGLCD